MALRCVRAATALRITRIAWRLSLPADYAAKILLGHAKFENRTSLALGLPNIYCVGVIHQLLSPELY
jgi:hypothetical protein